MKSNYINIIPFTKKNLKKSWQKVANLQWNELGFVFIILTVWEW